ncbi:hypothetical protein PG993_003111 [Apiospora rasikravindrae]|uniref:Small secreted protein n=1 Tax=Apiospora rasikravindrae TaxID=990691 RepID=A0ABR1U0S3_9PEZI
MQLHNVLLIAAYFVGQSCASPLPPSQSNGNSIIATREGAGAGNDTGDAEGAQVIIAGIGDVNENLDKWAGAVDKYKIGYLSLVPLDKAHKATEASLDDAIEAVQESKPLKEKEDKAVKGQIDAMLPKVKAVADELEDKAWIMKKEKVGKKVVEDAAGVQNKMDQLFASLQVVMTKETQPELKKAKMDVSKVMGKTKETFKSGYKYKAVSDVPTNEDFAVSNQTGKAHQRRGASTS